MTPEPGGGAASGGRTVSAIDPESVPPDPGELVALLATALASFHRSPEPPGARRLTPAEARAAVASAVRSGRRPDPSSPYARLQPERLVDAVAAGVDRVAERAGEPVPTIGRATFANLAPVVDRSDVGGVGLAAAANITFRRGSGPSPGAGFIRTDRVAISDHHRDLAVAAADVVATFGPGAVPAFLDAYDRARLGSVRPGAGSSSADGRNPVVDPIRLDWWSTVVSVLGPDRGREDPGPDAAQVAAPVPRPGAEGC